MRAAVIGTGVVGRAQVRMLRDHDVVTWDIADGLPFPARKVAGCDLALICAGTPESPDGSADVSQVRDAVSRVPGHVTVAIRSTVPPGTTAGIAAGRPGLTCHVPEFLHEREGGPWRDCTDVPFLIIGGDHDAAGHVAGLLGMVHPGEITLCSALEAELAKYAANLHWAVKVTFVNEMARICEASGASWAKVRRAWLADDRVTPIYTSMAGYEPGFGGRCWPKDLSALIAAADSAGYKAGFLRAVQDANARFRDDTGAR